MEQTDIDTDLIDRAKHARHRAYVPYSKFAMGAAVRTDAPDAPIVEGTLVENVSLGLAMCAERVALFATVAAGQRPTALALVSPRTDGTITLPCGACLQVALELGGPEMRVTASTPDGETEAYRLADLIPRGPRKR